MMKPIRIFLKFVKFLYGRMIQNLTRTVNSLATQTYKLA